ncbi:formylglycine-generating enzyme family protein [Hyphomicrobium sp. D-2]|uniref:formylglycine-generating enzyme family protein n=1 Tax=Hyphomicrobium sp. D-2 TaxID=3041621 RepID=UPI0024588C92|nr:formylglycine-generating enzyme family protein [Hyphomicrobium sp. D-2]MDH4983003.1 formylglycine-generating enzyme family protein [Hyphomicrobium sp. D-2]
MRLATRKSVTAAGDKTGMVYVPGGAFIMGSDRQLPEERSAHTVEVSGFWIDSREVTNAQFAEFVRATGYITHAERANNPGSAVFVAPSELPQGARTSQWWKYIESANWRQPEGEGSSIEGRERHPVVHVTYEDALAYANWRGHDLPTEAEWEYAARGGDREEIGARTAYDGEKPIANTWQGVFPVLNTAEDGFVGTAPVGCFSPNGYGLYDMIGNVWEWTSDWYRRGHVNVAAVNPKGPPGLAPLAPGSAPSRVIKGGSHLCAANYCARYRTTSRQPQEADLGTSHVGFRTVVRDQGSSTKEAKANVGK